MINQKEIIKEILPYILPFKLSNKSKDNIKLIKRKLNIYNLKNETNYSLNDLHLDIIYNRFQNETSIFYYYKELNKNFNHNLLNLYKKNYLESSKFLNNNLKQSKIYKHEIFPNSLFLFKGDKFILKQDLKNKRFYLSDPLIWSKLEFNYEYKWVEISNMCNTILEQFFKQELYTTMIDAKSCTSLLEEKFKQGDFITYVNREL